MRVCGLAAALLGCRSEFALEDHTRVDVFPQVRVNEVDLLLVIDNSCSMIEEQEHLAQSFDALISALAEGESDWRVAVTTTEASIEGYRGRLAGGADELVLVSPDGVERDRVAYDDAVTPLVVDEVVARDLTGSAGPFAVSRYLPWPSTAGCEWVELTNVTGGPADLSGYVLRDDGRDRITLPAAPLETGESVVIGRSASCPPVDLAFEAGFALAHGLRWVDPETPDAAEVFADLVSVGTSGFGLEMGFENARLALGSPTFAEANRGFLRPAADLSLLFLSDEDDISHDPVADYVDAFKDLKGDPRDRQRVRFGVVAGVDPPVAPLGSSCASDLGDAAYAERYVAFAAMTGGLQRSICEDVSTIAVDAGLTLSGLLVEWQLSGEPDQQSLSVELYDSEAEDAVVGFYEPDTDYAVELRADERGQEAWWLVFREAPPAEHWVVATYRVLP